MAKEPKPPEPGDVYLFPVADVGTGICRVLAKSWSETWRAEAFTLELAVWRGTQLPDLAAALATEALTLTHFREFGAKILPSIAYAAGELPADFDWLGKQSGSMPPGPPRVEGVIHWDFLRDKIALECEYRLRPDGFREFERKRMRDMERRARALMRRKPVRSGASKPAAVPELNWQPDVAPEVVTAGTRLLEAFQQELAAAKTSRAKAKALRTCVKAFNALDDTSEPGIDTVVAEEVFEFLVDSATAAGLENAEEVVEEVREF
ncbi:MAG: hypothetical protein QM704_03470 [Anaeromyxobacteraceae bacterium]